MRKINRKGQEEIVGFASIIVLVAVVLLVFLGFSLRKNIKEIQSYEAESFLQSFLQYTTDCAEVYETDYLSINNLIIACSKKENCLDSRDTCDVLNLTSKEIIKESWQIKKGSFAKGYNLEINSAGKNMLTIKEGNLTGNYKSSSQSLPENIEIKFKVFSS